MLLREKTSYMKTNYLLNCFKNRAWKMLLMCICICGCICIDNLDAIPYLFNKNSNITVCYYIVNSMIFGGQLLPYFGGVFSSGVLAAENCKERLCHRQNGRTEIFSLSHSIHLPWRCRRLCRWYVYICCLCWTLCTLLFKRF